MCKFISDPLTSGVKWTMNISFSVGELCSEQYMLKQLYGILHF
jgi:hypothetical protein